MASSTELAESESPWGKPKVVPFVFATALSFLLPMGLLSRLLFVPVVRGFSLPPPIAFGLLGLVEDAAIVVVLVSIVSVWEDLPLSSMGIRPPRAADLALAIAAAAAGVGSVSALEIHAYRVTPPPRMAATQRGMVAWVALPLWLRIAGFLGNGIAEEIGARGYLIERILNATRSPLLAVTVSGVGSALIHIPAWGTQYAFAVLPGETVFALVYLFRRNIWVCVAAHFFEDTFAGVIWPVLPVAAKAAYWRTINAFL